LIVPSFDSAAISIEVAFFPALEGMGLNPRGEIAQSIAAEVERTQRLIPRLAEFGYDPVLPIELPVVYVRAAMLAPEGAEQRAMLRLFDDPALAGFRDIGRGLCIEIDAVKDAPPNDVAESTDRCLRLLRVTATGATVLFANRTARNRAGREE
jgi:hypothetical protein